MSGTQRGPRAPEQIRAGWVEQALRRAGVLPNGVTLATVAVDAIGDLGGVNGEAYRLRPTYVNGDGPATLIAKFPAARAAARGVAGFQRWYQREVRFYTDLAGDTPLRTPHCYAAEIDPDDDYVLLLEDLRPRAQGDQLAGCTIEQARNAVSTVARLHARWWEVVTPPIGDWLPQTTIGLTHAQPVQGALARSWDLVRPTATWPDVVAQGMPHMIEAYPALLAQIAAPPATVVHGDYRLDNLFFGEAGEVAVIDWQFACRCRGMYDVAYFIGLNLDPAVRRAHEDSLIEQYVATLVAHGVADYHLGDAQADYRRGLLLAFAVFLIGAAGEQPNARMTRVHEVGLARLATAIVESGAMRAIDAIDGIDAP